MEKTIKCKHRKGYLLNKRRRTPCRIYLGFYNIRSLRRKFDTAVALDGDEFV